MEHVMTNHELWGPWIGSAANPAPRRAYLKHRAWVAPVFLVLCVLAICLGMTLAALGVDGFQL
jgi:hypothetical protein